MVHFILTVLIFWDRLSISGLTAEV